MKLKVYNKDFPCVPKKTHPQDAGYDVYTMYDFDIEPGQTVCEPLGFGIEVANGYACMLVPRSSTAKAGLISQTQIIDEGYSGEIHLIITNASKDTYHIKRGDRLVSLVFYKLMGNQEWKIVEELPKTERGTNGLGSSGR